MWNYEFAAAIQSVPSQDLLGECHLFVFRYHALEKLTQTSTNCLRQASCRIKFSQIHSAAHQDGPIPQLSLQCNNFNVGRHNVSLDHVQQRGRIHSEPEKQCRQQGQYHGTRRNPWFGCCFAIG